MKSYFPDINVWVSLVYLGHKHHVAAASWFDQIIDSSTVGFCRLTQLGFLRLITNPAVMESEVKAHSEAWKLFDLLANDPRVVFHCESDPERTEEALRSLTTVSQSAPQQWSDAYLAAFAETENLTLVTFDRALYKLVGKNAFLLR